MNSLLLAQAAFGWNIGQMAIAALIVAGIIGVFLVVARQSGITIPPFVLTILWIVFAVVIGVVAIKFLMSIF